MDGVDERPLAVRRKRRISTRLIDTVAHEETSDGDSAGQNAADPPKTPGKRKKRLRFSDPVETIASSSTGLTPALNRTKLLPAHSVETARKRLSLPTQLMNPAASPSSLLSLNSPSPYVVQFAPLRQAIDPRMMRRLRRNHMGEELNSIYAEQRKSKLGLQQEIKDLRKELAIVKDNGEQAADLGTRTPGDAGRIEELEDELNRLKQEMCEPSSTTDTTLFPNASEDRSDPNACSPDPSVFSSEQVLDLQNGDVAITGTDRPRSPINVVEASTQVDLPSPSLSDICRSGRLSFEYLFPGETALGLDVSDPQPLIEAMISRAEKLKTEIGRVEQKIAVSETSTTNMGRNFKDVLARLDNARSQLNALNEEYAAEKTRANTAELEVSTLEARMDNTREKCSELEKQRDENQRSIERLQPALDYYQLEVKELTQTILDLESSHEIALKDLHTELADDNDAAQACQQLAFEEAKSDLEAQVAAETTGRRKAEQSAVERLVRINELENRQRELQSAVHEKQTVIRDLESEIEQSKSGQEKEVGQLNVRIGELVSDLSSANAELAATRTEVTRLANIVEEEKAEGLKAVESIQQEMKTCANKVDAVKDDHAEGIKQRGEQVAQSFGLMTPVMESGRFRDAEVDEKVEGHVELVRGKKRAHRPDSGVEIWGMIAEEVEEEIVDDDVEMVG
ncbi:MAG: hypothetical protein Q9170_002671 [Blastenia crenularia]